MKKTLKKDNLTRMCEMLDRQPRSLKRLLGESMMFNEDDDDYGPEGMDEPTLDDMAADPRRIGQPNGQGIGGSVEKINQIRKIALMGVAELADDPSSKEYDLFKKVWALVDKSLEPKEPSAEQRKN